MADDIRLMEQANAQLRERLAISKELLDLNNRTASSTDEQYSKVRMIAELKQQAHETTAAQVDMMLQTQEQLQVEKDLLFAMGEEKTAAQEKELEMVTEILRMRREEPDALDRTIQKLRAKAAATQEGAKAAEAERKFVEEEAAAWGKNLANAMGFRKEQEGILKNFMKSKNKLRAMGNAMKAFVKQISLAQIGTKIMQSSFQLLTGVLTKLFGRRGGSGHNIHQFVKMTGQANTQLATMAKRMGKLAKRLRVGFDEGAKAVGQLMDGVTGFMHMSKNTQTGLAKMAVRMSAFNVEAELSAKVMDQMMTRWGQSGKEAQKSMMKMFNSARKLGIPISKYVEDFSEFAKMVPSDGRNIEQRFRKMAAAAKELGLQVKTMLDLSKGFETFEDATKGAAQMNQILGKAVFNNIDLMKAANESPEEFANKMNAGLKKAGKSFNDLSIYQKKAMAKAMKMDLGEAEKLFGGKKGDALTRVQKAQKSVNNITSAVKAFNAALKQTRPPRGGSRDFMTMVLREYNEITGGKFFRKLGVARKNLKEVIRAVARFIACWIRKIEKWFINAATGFIDAFEGAINWIGGKFGNPKLADDMRKWVQEIDGWGPVLIPLLGLAAGALIKIGGVVLSLIPAVISLGGALIKAFFKLPAILGGVRDRMGSVMDAFTGGGTIVDKMRKGWGALMGHTGSMSQAALQRRAQPVHIVNPTTGGTGAVRTDDQETGSESGVMDMASSLLTRGKGGRAFKLGKAGGLSRLWGGAKGALGGMWAGRKYSPTNVGGLRGMYRGFKSGRLGGIDKVNRLSQLKQLQAMGTPGGYGPQMMKNLNLGLGTKGVGLEGNSMLSRARRLTRAQMNQPGGNLHLTKAFKRLNPGATSKQALAAIKGGWSAPSGPTNMIKGALQSPRGGFGHPSYNANFARPVRGMMPGGTGSFHTMDKTARGFQQARNIAAGTAEAGNMSRMAQMASKVPGGAKALAAGGGLMKGAGWAAKGLSKALVPLGATISAVTGGIDIYQGIKKGDWSQLGSGLYDVATGAAMFIPVIGPVVSGVMMLGKAVYQWSQYDETARLDFKGIMDNMSERSINELKQEQVRSNQIQNLQGIINTNLAQMTGVSDGVGSSAVMTVEKNRAMEAEFGLSQQARTSSALQDFRNRQNASRFTTDFSSLQVDAGSINDQVRAMDRRKGDFSHGAVDSKFHADLQKKQDVHDRSQKLKAERQMKELKKLHKEVLANPLMSDRDGNLVYSDAEQALVKKFLKEKKNTGQEFLQAAHKELRKTDAWENPLNVEDAYENTNQNWMSFGVDISAAWQGKVDEMYSQVEADAYILKQRTEMAAGNLTADMREQLMSSMDNVYKSWHRGHEILLSELTLKEAAGSLDSAQKEKLSQLRGRQKVGAVGDRVLKSLIGQQISSGGFEIGQGEGVTAGRRRAGVTGSAHGDALLTGQLWAGKTTETGGLDTTGRDIDIDKDLAQIVGELKDGQVQFSSNMIEKFMGGVDNQASGMLAIIQTEVLDNKAFMVDGKVMKADEISQVLREKIRAGMLANPADFEKLLGEAMEEMKIDPNKAIDVSKIKSIEEHAQDFMDKGFKVSKKDIDNFASYEKALKRFSEFASKGDIQAKIDPIVKAVDKLREAGSSDVAGKFFYGLGTFFYHASYMKPHNARSIEKLGDSIAALKEKVTIQEMAALGKALGDITTPAGKGSATAVQEAAAALEAWKQVKSHVDTFVKDTTEGALFFKGGTIDQNVKQTTTVKLVVGGREFGDAALHGLRSANHITGVSAKPKAWK